MLATIILPSSHTCDLGNSGPPSGRGDVRAFASAWGRSPPRCDIVGVEYYVSGGSGLVDGRRHRADAVAAFRQSPTSARVDARGADRGGKASRSPGVRRPNVGSVCPRRGGAASDAPFRAWRLADCDAVRRAVADFARCRALRQLASAHRCGREDFGGPIAALASNRAPHLAVLRNVCDGGRQYAAAGQLPGRPHIPGRPPNLADQHRIVSAVRRLCARLRLDWRGPNHRSAGSDACDDGSHAALSRPFLQLVRHPRSQGARAQIYLLRRQRQSGRTSHRDRQCLQRVEAIADGRRVASGRNRRCPRSDRRARRRTCVSVAELRR